jgi:hypothetical protein
MTPETVGLAENTRMPFRRPIHPFFGLQSLVYAGAIPVPSIVKPVALITNDEKHNRTRGTRRMSITSSLLQTLSD